MDMIERVAKAIWENLPSPLSIGYGPIDAPEDLTDIREEWNACARAAIEAMRTPTDAMLNAMHDRIAIECRPNDHSASILNDREVWASVLDAALRGEMI